MYLHTTPPNYCMNFAIKYTRPVNGYKHTRKRQASRVRKPKKQGCFNGNSPVFHVKG